LIEFNKTIITLVLLGIASFASAVPDRVVLNKLQEQQNLQQAEAFRLTQDSQSTADSTEAVATPETKKPVRTLRGQAFKQLLNNTYPLTPEQIKQLHERKDETDYAIAQRAKTSPTPVSLTLPVDLSPGAPPAIVRLAAGFVTSVVFLDVTGNPWPIANYSLGNTRDFNIAWDKETNALFIQKVTNTYGEGNLAVRLGNLDTPIMLTLLSGQKEVDYRVDLRVLARGPYAEAPVVTELVSKNSAASLVSVLDGIPPVGSRELKVTGGNAKAWLSGNRVLLRTKLKILSPAWSATVASADGTKVYAIAPTPLVLASYNGDTIKITLTGL